MKCEMCDEEMEEMIVGERFVRQGKRKTYLDPIKKESEVLLVCTNCPFAKRKARQEEGVDFTERGEEDETSVFSFEEARGSLASQTA